MAAGCPHVKNLHLVSDKSFLNPRSWACADCGFTDSVWACLLCSNVACGRSNSRHALEHFQQTKHPIAVEVNHGYVHCYLCDDYVVTDNSSGDIALVQSLLRQVASQSYSESCSRSGHVIRPVQNRFTRSESRVEAAIDIAADKRYTALCHWRYSQLARAFNTWRSYVTHSKAPPTEHLATPTNKRSKRKKRLTPGMTGLRNLGNTCYMNAVLQSLSHLVLFRECFRQLLPESCSTSKNLTAPPGSMTTPSADHLKSRQQLLYTRQTTVECFQHITSVPPGGLVRKTSRQRNAGGCWGAGLSGGRGGRPRNRVPSTDDNPQCMSAEMHALMRVLWSGKWAVVTPHAVLDAVWTLIPSFHGYTQQDAQEFLCELLLVLQSELDQWVSSYAVPPPFSPHSLLPSLFQGQLLSKVTYSGCGHCSRIKEPFWDLSLDFPEKYQVSTKSISTCLTLQDLLEKFIEPEKLEGKLYSCDQCNSTSENLQHAQKQLLIDTPPDVLRFHLKRFYWSSRDRHKINTHVSFPLSLDITPYCTTGKNSSSILPAPSSPTPSSAVPSSVSPSLAASSSAVPSSISPSLAAPSSSVPSSITPSLAASSLAASTPTPRLSVTILPSTIQSALSKRKPPTDIPQTPQTPKVSFDLSPATFTYPSEQSSPKSVNSVINPSSLVVRVPLSSIKLPQKSLSRQQSSTNSLNSGISAVGHEGLCYRLSSVVVHHGTGFQSGHYTAYCWNKEAESWVHCNDARIMRCTEAELQACQAYILFYSREKQEEQEDETFMAEPCSKRRKLG